MVDSSGSGWVTTPRSCPSTLGRTVVGRSEQPAIHHDKPSEAITSFDILLGVKPVVTAANGLVGDCHVQETFPSAFTRFDHFRVQLPSVQRPAQVGGETPTGPTRNPSKPHPNPPKQSHLPKMPSHHLLHAVRSTLWAGPARSRFRQSNHSGCALGSFTFRTKLAT